MTVLTIDLETYSGTDLKACGVYRYVEDPDFQVLLFSYAFNDDPVEIVDLVNGERMSEPVVEALRDPAVTKAAFNANFERTCLAKHFGQVMDPRQWICTQVHALTLGLPASLELVAKSLKLRQQKDTAGKALIRYFSIPCKPTKSNGGRSRNLPEHDPERWDKFKAYCIQDVVVEREVRKKLERYPVSEKEWKLWQLDQIINDLGVRIDRTLVHHAITCDTQYQQRLENEAITLTGLNNPNSVSQLKEWLTEAVGVEVESLSKETIPQLLEQTECKTVSRVLKLRQEMAKTSVKKYQAMDGARCRDNRVRGLLQFYGASRTGRWAGRIIQPHNLPRNYLPDLDLARQLLRDGDYETLEMLFSNVPDTLSQLIRTALVPEDGCRFIVADFSAIEARVIAWLAGEKWRLDVFNTHGKIYEASASQMFRVPLDEIHKGSPLRQKGKIAELACGFSGGVNALRAMDRTWADSVPEEELWNLIQTWRKTNLRIVQFWHDVEEAALEAVQDKKTIKLQYGLIFFCEPGVLFIQLPSGRKLAYVRPQVETDKRFNKPTVTYEGYEQGKWSRLKTYGGKLTENIVQAIARDCLAEALLRVDNAGYRIVLHIHDEIVVEAPDGHISVDKLVEILGEPLSWAPGLPLRADGFEARYYVKD